MAEQQLIGALEAGGTKMVCATGYADGTVLEREQIATTTPQETVEAVNAWFADKGIAALGIGAFGPTAVNPASPQYGKILETPKTAWRYFDLLGTIQNELNIPCGYDTDVNVACLGEVTFGCAKGLTDVVYLTIGTGVGAGVLSGGKLVHGMMHPEAGHILVTRDPRDCATRRKRSSSAAAWPTTPPSCRSRARSAPRCSTAISSRPRSTTSIPILSTTALRASRASWAAWPWARRRFSNRRTHRAWRARQIQPTERRHHAPYKPSNKKGRLGPNVRPRRPFWHL